MLILYSLLLSLICISDVTAANPLSSTSPTILRGEEKEAYLEALRQAAALRQLQASLEELMADLIKYDEKLQAAYTEIKKEEQHVYDMLDVFIREAEEQSEITDATAAEDALLMLIALGHMRSELTERTTRNEHGVLMFSPLTRTECTKRNRQPLARLTKRESYVWYWHQWQFGCMSSAQFERGAKRFGRDISEVYRIFQ